MEEVGLVDLLSVLRRRIRLFFVVFLVVFCCALFFAARWSNYRSVATVEVALPEVDTTKLDSEETVQANREAIADLRISYLQQRLLSTASLVEIITKYNLYEKARKKWPVAEVAADMRSKISINMISSMASTSPTKNKETIAFDISFDYDVPLIAQQVTNELVSRLLDEDIKQRRTQAEETTSFLGSQLKVLEASLAEQEEKLAAFRQEFGTTSPEALGFNQQAMTANMMSVQQLESQLTANLGSQGALRAQLASLDPYSRIVADGALLTTPTIQLRALKSEYASLSAKYGAQHPDVIKISRQIEAMEASGKGGVSVASLKALLADAQARLSALQKTYGKENPEIKTLEKQIESYHQQIAVASSVGEGADRNGMVKDADNPAYLQVVAQLQAVQEQAKALEMQKAQLRTQMEKHQDAIIENPVVEQKLAALMRDYDNAQTRYRELKAKKLQSEMNEKIEQERVGQRLVMINPPELPLRTQPSRILFVFVGLVFAVFLGVGVVGGGYMLNPCVTSAQQIQALTGTTPLVTIPHLETRQEKEIRLQLFKRGFLVAVILVLLGVIFFSYAIMPLDVIFSSLMLKLGL